MTEQRIEPHRVTKPIQLLAAWLVGLVLTNTSFLLAAAQLGSGDQERKWLVLAAIVNVPIFLLALFLLQTRFRAELQEDTFYADYLSKKTASPVRIDKHPNEVRFEGIERMLDKLVSEQNISLGAPTTSRRTGRPRLNWSGWSVALNSTHPQFKDIRMALREMGIPMTEIFGRDIEPPERWVVSINSEMPFSHKSAILESVVPFNFDGFLFWEPVREAGEDEDVYIGSYGDEKFAKFNQEFKTLVMEGMEVGDLNDFYRRELGSAAESE